MAEKKSWFQKLKSAFVGEEKKEKLILEGDKPLENKPVQEKVKEEPEIPTPIEKEEIPQPEAELVSRGLQQEEAALISKETEPDITEVNPELTKEKPVVISEPEISEEITPATEPEIIPETQPVTYLKTEPEEVHRFEAELVAEELLKEEIKEVQADKIVTEPVAEREPEAVQEEELTAAAFLQEEVQAIKEPVVPVEEKEAVMILEKPEEVSVGSSFLAEEKAEEQVTEKVPEQPEELLVESSFLAEEIKAIEQEEKPATEDVIVNLTSQPQPETKIETQPEPEITPKFEAELVAESLQKEEIKEMQAEKTDSESVSGPVQSTPEETPKSQKKWLTKVINTLNAPIEFKIETPEGDDSWLAKLKGNVNIGLGKPVVERTDEDIEKWKEKLTEKLSLTRQSFVEKLERLLQGRTKIDEDLLEEIEEVLLESDVGVEMTEKICNRLREMAKEKRFLPAEVIPSLFDYLKGQLDGQEQRIVIDESKLNIFLMVGVNGTGKTTTSGKIAAKLRISDYSVILAAADTFRAAAIDQLEVWCQRAQVPIVKHKENSDAAAVVYDAIKAAQSRKTNALVIDTAGRLHNKVNLMEELRKIKRIVDREAPDAKVETLLVLDATTGQNGIKQAMVFAEAVNLTGVVLTKLDGTAKGGVIFSIKNTLNLPIKLVGVGEGVEDLSDFQPQIFVDALFSQKKENVIQESTKARS